MQRLADDGFLKRRLIIGKSSLARNIAFSSTLFAPPPLPFRILPRFLKDSSPLKQLFEKLKDGTVVVLTIVQARTLLRSQKTWECIISANERTFRAFKKGGGGKGGKYSLHIRDVKGKGDRKRKKGKREARCRVGDGLLFNGDSKTTLISNATSVSCARASADCSVLTILKGMLGRRENRQPLSTDIVGNL